MPLPNLDWKRLAWKCSCNSKVIQKFSWAQDSLAFALVCTYLSSFSFHKARTVQMYELFHAWNYSIPSFCKSAFNSWAESIFLPSTNMNWPNCWYGLDTEDIVGNWALSAGPFLRSQICSNNLHFACTHFTTSYMQAGVGKIRAGGAPGFASSDRPAAPWRSGCSATSMSSKTLPEGSCWLITSKTRLNHACTKNKKLDMCNINMHAKIENQHTSPPR